ncbi:hypothetical protein BAU15_12395 [Enterococcus sp. JM4C]|uniref:ABC transporter permease n=1 Tax=Candidatus Enterococcus huntleyi TaxID=1857217 RepID=UPI00137A4D50|nr:ABC transporter permease subunit [Enterococcus sp. JM4C]KAF1296072.1 hypothetical protein BAU15_12395 [Enterococcus sp. JM4C]
MTAVATEELRRMLRSPKAIVIILIFTLFSYGMSSHITAIAGRGDSAMTANYSSLRLLVFVFGYLFVSVVSHNCINEEIESGSIKFILSKINRQQFVLGKFVGITLFWLICIGISFITLSVLALQFHFSLLLTLMSVIIFYISLCIFISVVITKTSLTNFLGLIIGIALPIIGLWCTFSTKWYSIFKYLFPYEYIVSGGIFIVIPLLLSGVFLGFSIKLFKRNEV